MLVESLIAIVTLELEFPSVSKFLIHYIAETKVVLCIGECHDSKVESMMDMQKRWACAGERNK